MAKNILLIDDEPDFVELISVMLEFNNFAVDTFCDPVEFVENIAKKTYDLLITDLMMPHMDGFSLIERVRREERYKKTPIIVLSAKTLNDEERKSLLQHDTHFMIKPFEPQGLVDQVRNLLNE